MNEGSVGCLLLLVAIILLAAALVGLTRSDISARKRCEDAHGFYIEGRGVKVGENYFNCIQGPIVPVSSKLN